MERKGPPGVIFFSKKTLYALKRAGLRVEVSRWRTVLDLTKRLRNKNWGIFYAQKSPRNCGLVLFHLILEKVGNANPKMQFF